MSDDNNATTPSGSPLDNQPRDPLGILDWVIGGKYKIRAYIGGGGFGEVYEGYNVNLPEQKLVIKFFKRVQSRDKFAKEAKILCLLDHPNISRIIDFLPEEGAVVVAYIHGRDGGVILKESGPLKEELFLRVARAMTGAIAYAHEKKIAHRDIKPSNILIDRNDNVFLIDFGIAKEMGTDATKTAYQALTPMFAAPERQTGEKDYNPFLSDIYETGITLFNFATNDMPYRNPVSPNVDEWGGKASRILSPQLRRILKKATHPNPKKRYQTAQELADELKHLEQAFHHPRAFPVGLAAAAVVIILAVAVYFNRDSVKNLWANLFPPGKTE
jgi:serine/threonine protein kinase